MCFELITDRCTSLFSSFLNCRFCSVHIVRAAHLVISNIVILVFMHPIIAAAKAMGACGWFSCTLLIHITVAAKAMWVCQKLEICKMVLGYNV